MKAKRLAAIAGSLLALAAFATPMTSQAVTIDFGPKCDASGCGTATMDITTVGITMTLLLDNTSPLTLDDGTGTNTPGITGFGFNLQDPVPGIVSWSLSAFNIDGSGPVVIGDGDPTDDWVMNTTVAGVSLDYLPTAGDPAQIKGALYNPAAASGFGAMPNYETQATLVITFESAPVLAEKFCANDVGGDCETFVRMQNVGLNGGGSLKIGGGTVVPIPAAVWLFGSGLLGLVGVARRKKA